MCPLWGKKSLLFDNHWTRLLKNEGPCGERVSQPPAIPVTPTKKPDSMSEAVLDVLASVEHPIECNQMITLDDTTWSERTEPSQFIES